ncbi:MAG TPA: hypothetical protein VH084_28575 [Mycobacterium sp.]|nr:hypothetical protein [Mycobacterium sp.]
MSNEHEGCLTFYEVVKRYLERQGVTRIDRVLSVDQETTWGGYCETCAYSDIEVHIVYEDETTARTTHILHNLDLGEFIRKLDELTAEMKRERGF